MTESSANPIAKQKNVPLVNHQSVHYSGPIPPSSELARYNEIDPTFANRIMAMAEKNAENVRQVNLIHTEIQKESIKQDYKLAKSGQIFGFTLLLICFCAGIYLVRLRYQITGTLFSGIGLLPILKLFLHQPNRKNK